MRNKASTRIASGRSLIIVLGGLGLGASAAPLDPTPAERHTAECVAALEVDAEQLAQQIKAGRPELRPRLRQRLDHGAAFIGQAYLQGQRDEQRSQALLKAALEAQKSLSDTELAARQAGCAKEGEQLLANTNFIGRAVVSQLAQRRMKKLLSG